MVDMERFYRVFPWREDPESFKARVEEGKKLLGGLLGHPWLSRFKHRGKVRVLDAMGGIGVGGASVALALKEQANVADVEVTVLDVRESALKRASSYFSGLLGLKPYTVKGRIEDLPAIAACPFDIIIVYGLSAPHLDPYQMVKAAAGMASCLESDGVVVIEEGDRIYDICYLRGYREVLAEEAGEDRLVASYHAGYDPFRGVFKRLVIDHVTGDSVVAEIRMWDVAGLAAILWAFFKDVDYQPVRGPTRGFILASGPRGINPEWYSGEPRIALRSRESRT